MIVCSEKPNGKPNIHKILRILRTDLSFDRFLSLKNNKTTKITIPSKNFHTIDLDALVHRYYHIYPQFEFVGLPINSPLTKFASLPRKIPIGAQYAARLDSSINFILFFLKKLSYTQLNQLVHHKRHTSFPNFKNLK